MLSSSWEASCLRKLEGPAEVEAGRTSRDGGWKDQSWWLNDFTSLLDFERILLACFFQGDGPPEGEPAGDLSRSREPDGTRTVVHSMKWQCLSKEERTQHSHVVVSKSTIDIQFLNT